MAIYTIVKNTQYYGLIYNQPSNFHASLHYPLSIIRFKYTINIHCRWVDEIYCILHTLSFNYEEKFIWF